MAHLKIQPPGVVGLNNTDRKTIIRVIGGDTWSFSANLYNPADISEPATPENTVVTVNVADTQFDEIIWSGGWYTGVTADKNRKGLCYVEIPRSVTQNLRRGNYMFAIRVTDLLKTKFVTEAEGSILVEYKTTSDQHSIPYKDNTSNGGTSSGGTSGGGGGGGSVSGTVSWGNVTGKPSTFPPSTHTHAWSQVTDKPSTFKPESHTHKWSQVTDKPSTFTPSAHTHKWSQVTEKPSTFTPSAHEQDWSTITGTPDEYPPEAHKHPASDIIGMPSIEVDRTLTKDGVAANSKTVGDKLAAKADLVNGKVGTDQLPAFLSPSDIADWAKSPTKPSYIYSEVGAAAASHTHVKGDLSEEVQASLNKADTALQSFTEEDPTVPAWAKESTKPSYTYGEVGAAAETHTHVKSDLSEEVQASLEKADSALQSFTESDPTVPAWAKADTKPSYTYSEVGAAAETHTHVKSDLSAEVQASLEKADSALQSFTESDPTVPSWAKADTKPTYTAEEVGALPDTTELLTKESVATEIKTADTGLNTAVRTAVADDFAPLTAGSLAGINDYLLVTPPEEEGVYQMARDTINLIDCTGKTSVTVVFPEVTGRCRDFTVVLKSLTTGTTVDFGSHNFIVEDESIFSVMQTTGSSFDVSQGGGYVVFNFTEIPGGDTFIVGRRNMEAL